MKPLHRLFICIELPEKIWKRIRRLTSSWSPPPRHCTWIIRNQHRATYQPREPDETVQLYPFTATHLYRLWQANFSLDNSQIKKRKERNIVNEGYIRWADPSQQFLIYLPACSSCVATSSAIELALLASSSLVWLVLGSRCEQLPAWELYDLP